jgi:ClpP class serine protease
MSELISSSMLWAMHPAMLDAFLRRSAAEAIVPETVRGLLTGLAGGFAAGRAPEQVAAPVQEGSILIIPVSGMLAPAGMFRGSTSYDAIADRVREGAADKRVSTIVMVYRSPGGTVWGCEEAGDAIHAARSVKPVIAVADPFCFSAAYWLATQASRFYVTTSGEVGSVGVRSGHVDKSGFEDKIGMKTTLIASSPDKIAGHSYAPLADEDRADIQAGVDAAGRRFALAIARGRGMRLADVAAVHGTGKTFSARRALDLGAIDGIATLRDVIGRHATPQGRLDLMRRQAAVAERLASI